jgi:hypothetical protein
MKPWHLGIIILLLLGGIWYIADNRSSSTPIYEDKNPTSTSTVSTTTSLSVEDLVSKNISKLSVTKEQLGGTFYVTSIEAHGGAGTVKYEDGHNSYVADFTYATDANGTISITSFKER